MEGDGGRFGAAVVDESWHGHVACEGGDGDDGAVVGGHHGGEEFAREPEVGERVDGEEGGEGAVRCGEEATAVGDAGVQDEDGGVAVFGADEIRGGVDGFGGC